MEEKALSLSGPIHIYGETDLAQEVIDFGWTGSGTPNDPYMIEDMDIDGTGNSYGLFIGQTESHIKVKNCTIHDSDTESSPQYRGNGIYIVSSSNITIEECTIINNNSSGAFVRLSRNITISENRISSTVNGSGIYLWDVEDLVITGNSVVDVDYYGIALQSTNNCLVEDNIVEGSVSSALSLSSSANITATGNSLRSKSGVALGLSWNHEGIHLYSNSLLDGRIGLVNDPSTIESLDLPPNNTVDGSPIYYYYNTNELNGNAPLDAGQIICANITNFNIVGLDFSGKGNPVTIIGCSNITIGDCDITGVWSGLVIIDSMFIDIGSTSLNDIEQTGVFLDNNKEISLTDLTISSNLTGVYVHDSRKILISSSKIENCNEGVVDWYGSSSRFENNTFREITNSAISLRGSSSIDVTGNSVESCGSLSTSTTPIHLTLDAGATVVNNRIQNSNGGIMFRESLSRSYISGNEIMDIEGVGVRLIDSENTVVTGNLIFNCTEEAIGLSGCDMAEVFNNTFIGNNNSTDIYQTTRIQASDDRAGNEWDRSMRGNYWSDWKQPDENGDGIVDDPYLIFGGSSFDQYPLTRPTYEYLSAPRNFTAISGRTVIMLYWEEPSFDLDDSLSGYVLERTGENGSHEARWELGPDDLNYIDEDIANGKTYHYTIYAVNRLGEGTGSGPLPAMVDSTPPMVNITNPVNGSVIGSRNITFKWNATDDVGISEIRFTMDGVIWIDAGLNESFRAANMTEGEHIFGIRAFDHAGNNRTVYTEYKVDVSAPEIEINQPEDGYVTSDPSIEVNWSAADDISRVVSYRLRINNGDWMESGNATSRDIILENDGTYILYVQGIDEGGNTGEASSEITLDRKVPDIFFTFPPEGYVSDDTTFMCSWVAYDSLSGISRYMLSVDGGDWMNLSAGTAEFLLTSLSPGEHGIRIMVYDLAGNIGQADVSFTVEEGEENDVLIKGRVVDEYGDPVEGAKVTSDTGETVRTDSSGYFAIEVPKGIRTLTIEFEGFRTVDKLVDASGNGTVEIDDIEIPEKDEDDEEEGGLVNWFRERVVCQICCLLAIVVPLLLILLGMIRRSRNNRKTTMVTGRTPKGPVRDLEE